MSRPGRGYFGMLYQPLIWLVGALYLLPCEGAAQTPRATVTPTQRTYRPDQAVVFVLRNPTGDSLFATLMYSDLEQHEGDGWVHRGSWGGVSLPGPARRLGVTVVPPGGSGRVELPDYYVRRLESGTYRMWLWVEDQRGRPLPDSIRTSTAFRVRAAPRR